MKTYICQKCNAPMEKPVLNCCWYRCAYCGDDIDGWYPPEHAAFVSVNPSHPGLVCHYNQFKIIQDEQGRYWVEEDLRYGCNETPRPRKFPPRYTHHFDTSEVHDAMLGQHPHNCTCKECNTFDSYPGMNWPKFYKVWEILKNALRW